mmetsp:Transcript_44945/g.70462  ORF Transcript_44945/g.70462 Transcript_44945/m.70462 type:complete len:129 (+) Transcript_44945:1277-1663(+)
MYLLSPWSLWRPRTRKTRKLVSALVLPFSSRKAMTLTIFCGTAPAAQTEEEQVSGPIGYNVGAFHFAFALGVLYVGMQMTNWNEDFKEGRIDTGTASMWIKMADSWTLAIAYLWSMIAPVVLTGRDFN